MTPVQTALSKVWTVAKAVAWAIIGGGTGTLMEAHHQWSTYEDPLDLVAIRKIFITGAVIGLVGWWRKEVARATPVPSSPEAAPAKVGEESG
jgi:hypothetical protein